MSDSSEHETLAPRTPPSTHAILEHIERKKSLLEVQHSNWEELDLLQGWIVIGQNVVKHFRFACLWFVQMLIWPLVLALRRLTQSVLKSNSPKAIVSCFTRHSDRKRFTTIDIRVFPATVRRVLTFVKSPLQLCERIDRLLTRLEEVELVSTDRYYFPKLLQLDSANASPVSSENISDPFESQATASQIYHAALADNKSLDHLLASFDDQRALRHGGEKQEENGKVTQLTAGTGKYSIKSSGSWAARLGCADGSSSSIVFVEQQSTPSPPEADHATTYTTLASPSSTGGISAQSKQRGDGSKHPHIVRGTACDHHGGTEARPNKRPTKPRFITSMEPYDTVPKFKKSSIPVKSRPSLLRQ